MPISEKLMQLQGTANDGNRNGKKEKTYWDLSKLQSNGVEPNNEVMQKMFDKSKQEILNTLRLLDTETKTSPERKDRTLIFEKLQVKIRKITLENTYNTKNTRAIVLNAIKKRLEEIYDNHRTSVRTWTTAQTLGVEEAIPMCWDGIRAQLELNLPGLNSHANEAIAQAKSEVVLSLGERYLVDKMREAYLEKSGRIIHDQRALHNLASGKFNLSLMYDSYLDEGTNLPIQITNYIKPRKLEEKFYKPGTTKEEKLRIIQQSFNDYLDQNINTEAILQVLTRYQPVIVPQGVGLARYHIKFNNENLDKKLQQLLYITDNRMTETITLPEGEKTLSPEYLQDIVTYIWRNYFFINELGDPNVKHITLGSKHNTREIQFHSDGMSIIYEHYDQNLCITTKSLYNTRDIKILMKFDGFEQHKPKIKDALERNPLSFEASPNQLNELMKGSVISPEIYFTRQNLSPSDSELQSRARMLLHQVAQDNEMHRVIDILVMAHVTNVDSRCDTLGITALNIAVLMQKFDCVNTLLENGANANLLTNYKGVLDKLRTARQNNPSMKKVLTSELEGALSRLPPGHTKWFAVTPLVLALGTGQMELALELAKKTSVHERDTSLRWAIYTDQTDTAKQIIERGISNASTNKGVEGQTPLHMAAIRDNVDMIRFLLEKNADTNALCNFMGKIIMTPLGAALAYNRPRAIKYFIEETNLYDLIDIQQQIMNLIESIATFGLDREIKMLIKSIPLIEKAKKFQLEYSEIPSCIDIAIKKLDERSEEEYRRYKNVVGFLARLCPYNSKVFKQLLGLEIEFNAKDFIGDNDINEPIQELIQNNELDTLVFWDRSVRHTLEQEKQLESHSIYIAYHLENSYSMENIQSYVQRYQAVDSNSVRKFFCDCARASTQNKDASKILNIKFTDDSIGYYVRLFSLEMALDKLVQARPDKVVLDKTKAEDNNLIDKIKELERDFPIVQQETLYLKIGNGDEFRNSMEEAQEFTRPEIYIAEALLVAVYEDPAEMLRIYHDLKLEDGTVDIKILLLLINNNERYQRIAAIMLDEAARLMSDFLPYKFTLEAQEFLGKNQESREEYLTQKKNDIEKLANDQNFKDASELQELIKHLKKNMHSNPRATQYPEGAASQAAAASATGGASGSSAAGGSSATTAASGSSAAGGSSATTAASGSSAAGGSSATTAASAAKAGMFRGKGKTSCKEKSVCLPTKQKKNTANVRGEKRKAKDEQTKIENDDKRQKKANKTITGGEKRKTPVDQQRYAPTKKRRT